MELLKKIGEALIQGTMVLIVIILIIAVFGMLVAVLSYAPWVISIPVAIIMMALAIGWSGPRI